MDLFKAYNKVYKIQANYWENRFAGGYPHTVKNIAEPVRIYKAWDDINIPVSTSPTS